MPDVAFEADEERTFPVLRKPEVAGVEEAPVDMVSRSPQTAFDALEVALHRTGYRLPSAAVIKESLTTDSGRVVESRPRSGTALLLCGLARVVRGGAMGFYLV